MNTTKGKPTSRLETCESACNCVRCVAARRETKNPANPRDKGALERAVVEAGDCTTEPRVVRDYRIKHGGKLWDVSGLPGVVNGGTLMVNAMDLHTLRVVTIGEDGRPAYFLAPRIEFDALGFEASAMRFGTNSRSKH